MGEFCEEYQISLTKRSVSFAVLPIDSVLGWVAEPEKIRVGIENRQNRPVVKKDGHHVFMDLPSESWTVQVKSNVFFPERMVVDGKSSVIHVRLTPNRRYDLPSGADLYTGWFEPNQDIFARARGPETGIKLISYEERVGQGYMRLYTAFAINPVNKEFALVDEKGEVEMLCIAEKMDDGICRLTRPLMGNWQNGWPVYPVYRGRSDETGYLFLPLPGIRKEEVLLWR